MKNRIVKFAVMCALAGLAVGCGPQQKPEELTQLEEMRMSEESANINFAAPDAYRRCTELTDKAVDAWQDGEQATAKMYASLGQRQYATAKAEARRQEALGRIEAAEKESAAIKLQMETLTAKQDGLEKSIALMKTNIANADNANAELRIQMAMTEQQKAHSIEADICDASKSVYAQANEKLKDAGNKNAYGKREEASLAADEAKALYIKAYELAKPDYDKRQAAAQTAELQKALYEDAKSIVGPDYAETTLKSTRMIFAGAFAKDKYEIASEKLDALKRVAELAKKYPTAGIAIEGYTQKSSKQAFEVSQRRADATRDYLISQGVDYKRLQSTAKGKDVLRYNEKVKANRPLNDRVEIIFTLP